MGRQLRWMLALIAFGLVLSGPLVAQQSEKVEPPGAVPQKSAPDLGPMRTVSYETDEGTWIGVDVSPDGRTIVFDLLGEIYTVPAEGGEARLLLGGRAFEYQPRYSPDGKQIAFISDRDGGWNLWVMNADGTNLRQLSKLRGDGIISPAWTPDGEYILVVQRSQGVSWKVWAYHKDGGTGFALSIPPGRHSGIEPSRDGRYLYYTTASLQLSEAQIHRLDLQTGAVTKITSGRLASFRPKLSPDGRWLAFGRRRDGITTLRLRDLRTGAERELFAPITRDDSEGFGVWDILPHYTFTPDSRAILILRDGKIHRVEVGSGESRVIPFRARIALEVPETPVRVANRVDDGDLQVRLLRWLNFSKDGKRAVFSAVGKVWAVDLPDGKPRRLTSDSWREYAPALSPDGKSVAYVAWSDSAYGHVMVVPVNGGIPRRLTTIPGRYASPTWSPDGSEVAFVRGAGSELRQAQPDDDEFWEIMAVSARGGEARHVAYYPPTAFALRRYPQLTYSADGRRLFFTVHAVTADTLVSVDVDGHDRRVHLTFNAADEIVPSPDGRRLAVIRRDDVYVLPLPPAGIEPFQLDLRNPALPVQRISSEGASYVTWLDPETLAWAFTNQLYTRRLDADSARLTAEIRLTVPRDLPKGKVAFVDARIVTMRGDEVIERGTIVVDGNRIVDVGPADRVSIPTDATVVQARGKTIIPGLIDTHSHLEYRAPEYFPEQRWEYAAALAYGITTSFDPSAHNLDVFAQAELVEAGATLGPRIYSTGDVFLGDVEHPSYVPIEGIEDARRAVRRHKDYGAIMIKQYMQPRREQRQWVLQAAREEGVRITAEGGSDLALDLTLVLDGYTAFEHSLPITPVHRDIIELFARTGTHYTPTLMVAYGGPSADEYYYSVSNVHDDAKLRRFSPSSTLVRWRRWKFIPEEDRHFFTQARDAASIIRAGGRVDVGAHGERQGLGTHWELWTLADGGLTPLETIRAATYTGAVKLGLEHELGSLGPGMLADFLVLDANPLEDIRNTAKIRFVVKNGAVYDGESLARVWPERWEPPRFFWQTEEERRRFAPPAPVSIRANQPGSR